MAGGTSGGLYCKFHPRVVDDLFLERLVAVVLHAVVELVVGFQVEKGTAVSQSKSNNVWIWANYCTWIPLTW